MTIRNCIRHGDFVETEKEEEEGDDRSIETQEGLTDKTHQDWMDIDRDFQTSEEYSEDQINQSIVDEQQWRGDDENDKEGP